MKPAFTIEDLVDTGWPYDDKEHVDSIGCGWRLASYVRGGEHRWFTEYDVVITNGEEYWSRTYLVDNSESQDGQFTEEDRWTYYGQDWTQVRPVEKTVIVYVQA